MKLVVNAYLSILIEGVAETMELADRLGIGHRRLAEVIEGGPLDAPLADAKFHKMDRGDFAAEFPLEWALKDVDLVINAAGVRRCRCWTRCLANGMPPWPPGTAARTSAPPAWPWPLPTPQPSDPLPAED